MTSDTGTSATGTPATGASAIGTPGNHAASHVTGRHAVVLGAGIAGLLAARVLAESFDRVSVIDRDVLDDGGGERRGVPQARHLHALMDRGRQIVEELYPGVVAELTAAGAPTSEALVGGRWYLHGRRVGPVPTGLVSVLASRALLETVLRRRTAQLPGVRLLPRTAAVGLVTTPARSAVTGVRVRPVGDPSELTDLTAAAGDTSATVASGAGSSGTGSSGSGSEVMLADLVVDASGRGSRSVDWLEALGHAAPPTSRVEMDLGYVSRLYRRRPEHLDGNLSVIVATAPGLRGGGAVAVEDDRWIVTLAGLLGDHPPVDHDGFEAFACGLPVPDVGDLVRSATPITDPVPYRFQRSVRRHFEAVRTPLEGLVVVGDALCSFNPLYAQGMTVAAQQALVLRDCLRERRPQLTRRFYRAVAPAVDVAWDMATSADLRYPAVVGRRSVRGRLTGSYAGRAQLAAHHDEVVARTLMRVVNLVDPPTALLRPSVAARVLAPGGTRSRAVRVTSEEYR